MANDLKKKSVSDIQKTEGNFTYNGLDRIDSSKGHTLDNVVTCCATCNYMKRSMTHDEFIDHIDKVYNHTSKRKIRKHVA